MLFFNFIEKAHSIFNRTKLQISEMCLQKSDFPSILTKNSFEETQLFKIYKILKRGFTGQEMKTKLMELNAKDEIQFMMKISLKIQNLL